MDTGQILGELAHREGLPEAALKAASAQRAEMVPRFLREIETRLTHEPTDRDPARLLFFIFHLFGEWREKSAYRPLAHLLRLPDEEVDEILGDAVTATTHRVMAAVFDGDPQPLYDIILDRDADPFIRSRMCEALAMLVLRGDPDRTPIARFLRDAFMELQPQAACFVWFGWQSAIAMLGLGELKSLVKRAFDRGFVDRGLLRFEHFQTDLEQATRRSGEPGWAEDDEYTLFGDTIDELSQWYGFSERCAEERETGFEDDEAEFAEALPYRNPFRGVGRNAPCPCGSGKKFKNCCLDR